CEVPVDELQNLLADLSCEAKVLGQRRRDQRGAWQCQSERLGEYLAGAGAAHELAGATRRTGNGLRLFQVFGWQLTPIESRAKAPHLVRRDEVRPVELRATRQVDRGNIATCDRHQVCRYRLVVARDEDHA